MPQQTDSERSLTVAVLLYPGFDLLDLASVTNVLGLYPDAFNLILTTNHDDTDETNLPAEQQITSQQGVTLSHITHWQHLPTIDIVIIPGGEGAATFALKPSVTHWLKQHADTRYICAFSLAAVLLAEAGLLLGKSATTSKKHYRLASQFGIGVDWYPVARWVRDQNIFTSSGGIAGLDMMLALLAALKGEDIARKTAIQLEHIWINDPNDDPFAPLHVVQ